MNNKVAVVGISDMKATRRRDDATFFQLAYDAAREAITDAGLTKDDIEHCFFATANENFNRQPLMGIYIAEALGWAQKPLYEFTNAGGASGSALTTAYNFVASGQTDLVLVLGGDKISDADVPGLNGFQNLIVYGLDCIFEAPFGAPLGQFALLCQAYMSTYNITEEQAAKVSVKNHGNAMLNPKAQSPMEITVDTSEFDNISMFRNILYNFSDRTGLDVSLRNDDIFQKPKRVVVFDCDSTIVKAEVIDELAKVAGVSEHVKEMTARAMNGELDFKQAIKERVRLLKGLTVEQLKLLSKTIRLTPGTEELISTLHFMGYKVAVISGGFSFFTDYLKEKLKIDYVFANELVIENGITTGEIKGDIIDAERKGEILKQIAKLEDISVDQIVAVGDGANDRFMLENAGLAIAFSPKEILKKHSNGIITSDNIFGLLYFLGVPDSQLKKIKKNASN